MPKLFVAIGIPEETAEQLAAIQPQPRAGIRLVEPRQMHVTLHYIGEVDEAKAQRMGDSLATVDAPAFLLAIAGVGCFPPSKGAVTLWAGVQECAALRLLHASVARVLAVEGFQPESRPYTPHVTLARCEADALPSVMSSFLDAHQRFLLPAMHVSQFGLYSTTRIDDVPHYRLERVFLFQR